MNMSAERQTIRVYIAPIENYKENLILPEYAQLRIAKMGNERKKREKAAGYGLLQYAIGDMGINAGVRDCFLTETGKPVHNDFAFSITHADGVVAVAVSDSGSVGVDIEPKNNEVRTDKLLDKIITSEEKYDNSLVLWTKKEACFKYMGKERIFTPKIINTEELNTKSIAFKMDNKDFVLSLAGNNNFEARFLFLSDEAQLINECM